MTDAQKIAEFLATKGATKVETGARAMSEHEVYSAVRGEVVTPIPERHVIYNHTWGEVVVNADGEPI